MESLVFVALSPVAALLTAGVGVVAWRRREVPGGRALAAFALTGAGTRFWFALPLADGVAAPVEAVLRPQLSASSSA